MGVFADGRLDGAEVVALVSMHVTGLSIPTDDTAFLSQLTEATWSSPVFRGELLSLSLVIEGRALRQATVGFEVHKLVRRTHRGLETLPAPMPVCRGTAHYLLPQLV